jgi:hypothetical protein
MRLVPAGGSPQMQRALTNRAVQTIASTLSHHPELLALVAPILKIYDQRNQAGLEQDLDHLQLSQSRPSEAGFVLPAYVVELVQALHDLYQQRNEIIRYQRGALLEILTHSLVCPRYQPNECYSDYRFVDEHGANITEQVDIAALSQSKRWAEGYECKLKANSIESSHCTGLTYLAEVAQQEGYRINVGFVALDDERVISRRIAHLSSSPVLKVYGLNTLWLLRDYPF